MNWSWPGEVPAIYAGKPPLTSTAAARPDVDARDEPGHDDEEWYPDAGK